MAIVSLLKDGFLRKLLVKVLMASKYSTLLCVWVFVAGIVCLYCVVIDSAIISMNLYQYLVFNIFEFCKNYRSNLV